MSDFKRNQANPNAPFSKGRSQDGDATLWQRKRDDMPPEPFEPNQTFGMKDDPFTSYDEPFMNQPAQVDEFAMWQDHQAVDAGFLADEHIPFGAGMQQGGVPLFGQGAPMADDFYAQAGDAPTRLARPISTQMVNKRTTVERGSRSPFAAHAKATEAAEEFTPFMRPTDKPRGSGAPDVLPQEAFVPQSMEAFQAPIATANPETKPANAVRRRRSDRNAAQEKQAEATIPNEASRFDTFTADDGEVNRGTFDGGAQAAGQRYGGVQGGVPEQPYFDTAFAPQGRPNARRTPVQSAHEEDFEQAQTKEPVRRPAPSARAPMQSEGQPMQRPARQPTLPDEQVERPVQRRPAEQNPRPMKPQPRQQGAQPESTARPQGQPLQTERPRQPAQRPVPQERRPMKAGMPSDEPPVRKQLQGAGQYAQSAQERNMGASVERQPYEFENEEEEEDFHRRGGVLLPIVIVLLIIGGLLAGICLPDWANMGGGIGQALNGVKTTIISGFTSVKDMVFPTEEPIKSFSVTAVEGTAPTQVVFNVQTTKNVTGIRIADDLGKDVYASAYNADTELSGEVINNSNVLLWKPTYMIEEAYTGGFTVYTQKQDGTESEGVRSEGTVTIAAAKPVAPPIQSFLCDTQDGSVPATLGFTVITSPEVIAVRIVDSYDTPVATLYDTDANSADNSMTENGDIRTWTLTNEVTAAYAGDYTVQYQTIADGLSFTPATFSVQVELTASEPEPTVDTAKTQSVSDDQAIMGEQPIGDDEAIMAIAKTDAMEPIPTPAPTVEATQEPTPEPTATLAPQTKELPKLEAVADAASTPDAIKLKVSTYSGGKLTKTYTREKAVSILSPFTTSDEGSNYAVWKQAGVLTFRSGPMRQNASYGTVEVENEKLTQLWTQPVGSMKVNKATLYGVGYPGQPVVVKWPTEVRQRMGVSDEMKQVVALKEVIMAGQDGKLYFYNLLDGVATRDPIELGAPSAGGLSVATNGTPILGVGQSHSRLANKNVSNGYHLINLLTNKKEELIKCDEKDKNSNYTGVLGAALFESQTGTMFFGSQNGVMYSVVLGAQKDAYDHQSGKIILGTEKQGYKTQASQQNVKNTNINASIAMYNNYAFYGDAGGIVQCVDVNTLTPVWAVNTGDAVSATPALDMEDDTTVALYTGNTILNMGKKGTCTIRRLDALTGAEKWQYVVPELGYTTEYEIGCMASPIVGQQGISDLVIFTVSKGAKGAAVIAFDKQSGAIVWETALPSTTVSSPVAVYNQNGDAWIVQAEKDGNVNLMDAKSGAILNTLKLDGEIEASPAVYGNLMIIGTTGKGKGSVVCLKIE